LCDAATEHPRSVHWPTPWFSPNLQTTNHILKPWFSCSCKRKANEVYIGDGLVFTQIFKPQTTSSNHCFRLWVTNLLHSYHHVLGFPCGWEYTPSLPNAEDMQQFPANAAHRSLLPCSLFLDRFSLFIARCSAQGPIVLLLPVRGLLFATVRSDLHVYEGVALGECVISPTREYPS
jgi:hypothetical protein